MGGHATESPSPPTTHKRGLTSAWAVGTNTRVWTAPRMTSTLATTSRVRGIRDLSLDMFFPCTMHPRATTPDARSALRRLGRLYGINRKDALQGANAVPPGKDSQYDFAGFARNPRSTP